MADQRNFNVVGKNLILFANMILNNQKICKLLYYSNLSPLTQPDIIETDFLMNKNIRVVPKVPDFDSENGSFIVLLMDEFILDPSNEDMKLVTIRFDIICPMDEWIVNEDSLRPFLIMSELQTIFDGLKINGVGRLRFINAERIVLSENHAGYSMKFNNYEFN